jgi:hypothetical protein
LRLFAILLAACASTSALTACTTVGAVVKKDGPPAKATLDKLAKAKADLATRPLVTKDAVSLPPGDLRFSNIGTEGNVLVTYLEDLDVPGELGNVKGRLTGTALASECASLLEHETYPWDPGSPTNWDRSVLAHDVEKTLATCGRAKVALVIRTTEFVAPSSMGMDSRRPGPGLDGGFADAGARDAGAKPRPTPSPSLAGKKVDAGADAALAALAGSEPVWGPYTGAGDASMPTAAICQGTSVRCRFEGWYVKAEVHVFSLEPFAHQGAFVFEAESTERIAFTSDANVSDLERDFTKALATAFGAAVKKNVPTQMPWVP